MKAYASRTGTKRNLAALREAGWGLFVSALGVHSDEGFEFWIECAAWSFFQLGMDWHDGPVRVTDMRGRTRILKGYSALLASHGRSSRCTGIVAPDVVCGGTASLRLSLSWLDRLLEYGPRVYLPVQPGITPTMIERYLGARVGVFVGGDTAWKEATCGLWARAAHEAGTTCHVGRVNTLRRLLIAKAGGADSFDGSGPSRYEAALREMEAARAVQVQLGLELTVQVTCFDADGAWDIEVRVGAAVDAILLAAADAGVGEVFEIQADDGVYSREGDGLVFRAWAVLGPDEVSMAPDAAEIVRGHCNSMTLDEACQLVGVERGRTTYEFAAGEIGAIA